MNPTCWKCRGVDGVGTYVAHEVHEASHLPTSNPVVDFDHCIVLCVACAKDLRALWNATVYAMCDDRTRR
jgi:hypothetical protein